MLARYGGGDGSGHSGSGPGTARCCGDTATAGMARDHAAWARSAHGGRQGRRSEAEETPEKDGAME